jgi:hypothetical protein
MVTAFAPRGPIVAQTSRTRAVLECGAAADDGSDLCLECGFVVGRRFASFSSARPVTPEVAVRVPSLLYQICRAFRDQVRGQPWPTSQPN